MKKNSGFVLVATLSILAFLAFVTQQLLQRMMVHDQFDHVMIAREKAKMIALGGISLAQMQLSERDFKNYEKVVHSPSDEKKNKADEKIKNMLSTILPHLNRWQHFPLTTTSDGVEGELKICIMCEHGKLNLNALFNFEKKEFSPEAQSLLKGLAIKSPDPTKALKEGEILKLLTDYLKKRGKPLDDVSELTEIPKLGKLALYYEPPAEPQKNIPLVQRDIKLTDLFTIWTPDEKIEPWLLSDGMCAMLEGLRRPSWNDAKLLQDQFKKAIAQFKRDLGTQWTQNWKILEPIYTKTPRLLNEIAKILSQQFDPTVYTVISSGTVQGIEQRVLAVLMKKKKEASSSSKEKKQEKTDKKTEREEEATFKIMKLYWL